MRIYTLIFFFLFSTITPTLAMASYPPLCNVVKVKEHHKIPDERPYCIETEDAQVTFVNLSSNPVEVVSLKDSTHIVYPNEYVITTGRLVVANSKGAVVSKEERGIIVARDYGGKKANVNQRIAPLAVWIPSAIGGAILGGMGVVASNPSAGLRPIVIGAFSGALGGALGPLMGAGQFGVVAGGALGVSAGGACSSCHI
ncbi:hypothetical protein ACT3QV_003625 [Vibrio alginolyticus]|uniref:hypothetical protein n=2 Tax=Bacteria TaxID=2 RepID=UPI0027E52C99|nr:hypothetical protein [Vibrio alginolyticus]WMO21445.1 hypothetical protein NI375_24545 [Vibrio alginolyticus]